MSSVDNRIVNMEFNNDQFEAGISESIQSLDHLKKSLQLKDATTGISSLSKSVNAVNVSHIANAVDDLSSRFSNMGVVGMTAIAKVTSSLMNFGARTMKSILVDPVIGGFQELELQNKAIQTILANTAYRYGTTVDQVKGKLDELNTYADKTIYNFSQMTDNIGKFTAAGVDLDRSVTAIKGMSNLGAFMGAEASSVTGAMYQMSQAMAAGKVQLLDWRSMELRGLAGTEFQEDIIRTARHMGIEVDKIIEANGGFRESLQEGWLTNDVFLESLSHFSQELSSPEAKDNFIKELAEKGYVQDEIDHILYLSETANKAATEVRSWTQLWDTLAEEAGSGWAQTWDLIFGGYEEGIKLWNGAYKMLQPFVSGLTDMRNFVVRDLVHTGSIEGIFTGIEAIGKNALNIFDRFKTSFSNTFGLEQVEKFLQTGTWDDASHIGKVLSRIAWAFNDFTTAMTLDESQLGNLESIFDGLNSVLVFGLDILSSGISIASEIGQAFSPLLDVALTIGGAIGDAITYIKNAWLDMAITDDIIAFVGDVLYPIHEGLTLFSDFIKGIVDVADALASVIFPGAGGPGTFFAELGNGIEGFLKTVGGLFRGTQPIFDFLREIGTNLTTNLISKIKSGGNIFEGLWANAKTTFGNIGDKAKETASKIGEAFSKTKVGQDWARSFTGLNDTVENEFKKTPVTFRSIFDVCKEAVKGFVDFLGTTFTRIFPNLSAKITDFFRNLPTHISNFMERTKEFFKADGEFTITGFMDKIREKIEQVLEFLKDKRSVFTDKVTSFFSGAYDKIKEILPRLGEGFSSFLDIIGNVMGVENIEEKTTIFDKVGAILMAGVDRLKEAMGPVVEGIQSVSGDIGKAFGDFGSEMFGTLEGVPWGDLAIVVTFISAANAFNQLASLFKTVRTITIPEAISKILDNTSGVLSGFADLEKQAAKNMKWAGLTAFTKSLPPLIAAIGAIAGLAIVNPDAVNQAIFAFIAVIGALGLLMKEVDTLNGGSQDALSSFRGSLSVSAFVAPILGVAAAVWIISGAIKSLSGVHSDKLIEGLNTVTTIWAMLMGSIAALSVSAGYKGEKGVASYNPGRFSQGKSVALMLLGMAASIRIVSEAVKQIGELKPDEISAGLDAISKIWLELTLGVVAAMLAAERAGGKGLSGASGMSVAASFLGMALAIQMISGPLQELSKMDTGEMIQGVAGIGALLLAIGEALNLATKNAAVGSGPGMFGLAAFVLALAPLMGVIKELGQMDVGQAATGLITFGIALGMLTAAINFLAPLESGLNGVANAILKFGAATALIGIGLAGISHFVKVLSELDQAVPEDGGNLAEAFTNAIKAACEAIVGSADAIGKAFVELIVSALNNTAEGIPRIAEAFAKVLKASMAAIRQYVPDLVHEFMGTLEAIFQQIGIEIGNSDFGANFADSLWKVITPIVGGLLAMKGFKVGWGDVFKMITLMIGVMGPLATFGSMLQSTANEYSAGSIAALDVMFGEIGGFILAMKKLNLHFAAGFGTEFLDVAAFSALVDTVMAILGIGGTAILSVMGWVNDSMGGSEQLKKGVEAFNMIGEAIGGFIGGIGGGIVGGYQASQSDFLPRMAENLETFTNKTKNFRDFFMNMDDQYIGRMQDFGGTIGGMVSAMMSAPFGGLGDLLAEVNIRKLGYFMTEIGGVLQGFDNSLGGVDVDKVHQAADAVGIVSEVLQDLPEAATKLPSIKTIFEGRKQTLGEFAEDLGTFFTNIQTSMGKINGIENFDFERLNQAKDFAVGMSEFAKTLPEAISAARVMWGGKQTLGEFGQHIGEAMKQIYGSMNLFNDPRASDGRPLQYTLDRLYEVKDFLQALADLDMPDAFSAVEWLFGGNKLTIGDLAGQLRSMAHTLMDVDWDWLDEFPSQGTEIGGRLQNFQGFIKDMATAASSLSGVREAIDTFGVGVESNGLVVGLVHENFQTLGEFAKELSFYSTDFQTFFEAVSGWSLGPGDWQRVGSMTSAVESLAQAQLEISQAADLNVHGGSDDINLMNLANFAHALADGFTDKNGNKTTFMDAMHTISDGMAGFDAPHLDLLGQLATSIKTLAEGYKTINDVTLPESLDWDTDGDGLTGNIGKITAIAQDAKEAVPDLKELATAFDGMDEDGGIPTIEKLQSGVSVIRDLADIYNDVISPFIKENDTDTSAAWGAGGTKTHYKALEYDNTIKPLEDLASQLKPLGEGLRNFQNSLKGFTTDNGITVDAFDPAKFDAPLALLERFRDFGSKVGNSDWGSEGSVGKMINSLSGLGANITLFAENVKGFAGSFSYYDAFAAVNTASKVAELGGVVTEWDTTEISEMSDDLGPLAKGLKAFHDNIGANFDATRMENAMPGLEALADGFNKVNINEDAGAKVDKVKEFIGKLVEAFGGTNDTGEQLASDIGDSMVYGTGAASLKNKYKGLGDHMTQISSDLSLFGTGLEKLNAAINAIPEVDLSEGGKISSFVKAIQDIIKAFVPENLGEPGADVTSSWFFGSIDTIVTDINLFASAISSLGAAFRTFQGSDTGGDVSAEGPISSIKSLSDLITTLKDADLPAMSADMTTLGTAIQTILGGGTGGQKPFGFNQGDLNQGVGETSNQLQSLMDLITLMGSTDIATPATALQGMATALSTLTGAGVETGGEVTGMQPLLDFLTQLQGFDWTSLALGVTTFTTALSDIATQVSSASAALNGAITIMMAQVLSILDSATTQFGERGKQAVQAYADAISNSGVAETAANFMANRAAAAAGLAKGAFETAGEQAAAGFARGIERVAGEAVAAAARMAAEAAAALATTIEIGSPSKVFMRMGEYSALGYALGMSRETPHVARTTSQVMVSALNRAYELAQEHMNMQPVIEPVIDMSSVDREMGDLDGRFGIGRSGTLARAVGAASAIAARLKSDEEIQNDEGASAAGASITNNYTQNITSPKALSRLDIYRDTKNLFALEKGVATREKNGAYVR